MNGEIYIYLINHLIVELHIQQMLTYITMGLIMSDSETNRFLN